MPVIRTQTQINATTTIARRRQKSSQDNKIDGTVPATTAAIDPVMLEKVKSILAKSEKDEEERLIWARECNGRVCTKLSHLDVEMDT